MSELLLSDEQRSTVEEFAKTVAGCQAVSYVAIMKNEGQRATYRTGGYKTPGPTITDMAKALGVVCAELAHVVMDAQKHNGAPADWDEVIQLIFDALADGAENARVMTGRINLREVDLSDRKGPLTGPGSAPRGF